MEDWKKRAINFAIEVYSKAIKDLKDTPQEMVYWYLTARKIECGLCAFFFYHDLASTEEVNDMLDEAGIERKYQGSYVCHTPIRVNGLEKKGVILALDKRLKILKKLKKNNEKLEKKGN